MAIVKPKKLKTETPKEEKTPYFEAKGSRKTAVARIRIFNKKGVVSVNGRELQQYFPDRNLQKEALLPLESMNVADQFAVSAKVSGGGIHSQAGAIAHGLARALLLFNPDFRKKLRRLGFLTRDSRMVERKKYGLKKARRAPQWAKR